MSDYVTSEQGVYVSVIVPMMRAEITFSNLGFYKLGGKDGHEPILCQSETEFMQWMVEFGSDPDSRRRVGRDVIGGVEVSTVFLFSSASRYCPDAPPMLFETMIFGGKLDRFQTRYASWNEALAGHREIVATLEAELPASEQGEALARALSTNRS